MGKSGGRVVEQDAFGARSVLVATRGAAEVERP
jgi:hypothetical protein